MLLVQFEKINLIFTYSLNGRKLLNLEIIKRIKYFLLKSLKTKIKYKNFVFFLLSLKLFVVIKKFVEKIKFFKLSCFLSK